MNDSVYEVVAARLDGASDLSPDAAACIRAAADGSEALAAHLAGEPVPAKERVVVEPPAAPTRVYLEQIAVANFRGVSEPARLPLDPSPGLTLVVGRNGSGKSSFAEGLEMLLTASAMDRWNNYIGRRFVAVRFDQERRLSRGQICEGIRRIAKRRQGALRPGVGYPVHKEDLPAAARVSADKEPHRDWW